VLVLMVRPILQPESVYVANSQKGESTMYKKKAILFAVLAAGFSMSSAFSISSASAWHNDKTTICERTAKTMYRACGFDVRDDFVTTIANCLNISNPAARRICKKNAVETKIEEFESCEDVFDAREDVCELLGENRYDPDPLLDPHNLFVDPDDVGDTYMVNSYVSIEAGHTYVLRAGEEGEETVVVHVTEDSREIQGVLCRVVADIVFETSEEDGAFEYEVVESTDDWFAQTVNGDIFYCGEVSRNFEDGVLRDLDGSFEAGLEFAKSGTLIQAFPAAGDAHRQEFSLGEAEDIIQYVSLAAAPSEEEGGDNGAFPCNPDQCLKTLEHAPLEPDGSEFKYYLAGIGFVLAVAMEDGEFTGEREELVCIGDSLAILLDPSCEIGDPEGLLEELCKLAPDAFCGD